MTGSPPSAFAAALAERGIRLTRQRRILLDLLETSSTHLRARDLLAQARLRDPGVNRATVYRTLSLLKHAGLVDELDLMHLEGEDHYYEPRGPQDHVHIGCADCGRIVELKTDLVNQLKAQVEAETDATVDSVRIEVRVRCGRCVCE